MSQFNPLVIENKSFPATRADINLALQAVGSNNSFPTEPATKYANMFWYDETAHILKMRSELNDAWISIGYLDQSSNTFKILDDTVVTTAAGVDTDGIIGDQTTGTWEAGTGATESLVSPAKVSSAVASKLNVTGSAPIYGVRAWVNFVGNGSSSANATLNGSGNISTVYKAGTGRFTATFTTALPDANYGITFAAGVTTSESANDGTCIDVYARTASAFSFTVTDPTGNNYANPHTVMITVIR
jgi:hypothetical protein